jgi:hypothetical protein
MEQVFQYASLTSLDGYNDIILASYTPQLEITIGVAEELVQNRLQFSNGVNHFILIDFSNVKSVTKEARDFMNDPKGGLKGVLGGAFVSNNAVATFFVNLYIKINKPSIPARFFTNRVEALEWLVKLRNTTNLHT